MKIMDEADYWWVSQETSPFRLSGAVLCNRCQQEITRVYPAVTYNKDRERTGTWYLCSDCRDIIRMEQLL